MLTLGFWGFTPKINIGGKTKIIKPTVLEQYDETMDNK